MLHGIILIEFYNIFKILIGFENFNKGGPLNLPFLFFLDSTSNEISNLNKDSIIIYTLEVLKRRFYKF